MKSANQSSGKMMDFTVRFIVTITSVLYSSPSAYSGTYVNLTAILSAPGAPFRTFLSALQTENVIQTLQEQANSQEGLTLFAPNDMAIARSNIDWDTVSTYQTKSLLLFHAIPKYVNNTFSDFYNLCQLSPVTTMAGVQYTLNVTLNVTDVSNAFYVNSGWTSAEVFTINSSISGVYQIYKVLLPEAIFGIPPSPPSAPAPAPTPTTPPPHFIPATAPSALTTSAPSYNESGNYPPPKPGKGLSGGVIAGISIVGVAGALLVAVYVTYRFHRKNKSPDNELSTIREEEKSFRKGIEKSDSIGSPGTSSRGLSIKKDKSVKFSYEELAKATHNFSNRCIIGRGSFGAVYQAEFGGKEAAAIKKMGMTAKREFQAELKILTHFQHVNLVHLIGYCVKDSLYLVYECMENGTLSQHLHEKERDSLSWPKRLQIAQDSARGLRYIHEDIAPVYIHRNIKSANILIDKNFSAKVADVGVTKLAELGGFTNLNCTHGYIPPESVQCCDISPKVDVYAFGVVLYEIISAQKAIVKSDGSTAPKLLASLFEEALNQPNPGEALRKLIDPRLGDYPPGSVLEMALLAQTCTHVNQEQRPSMGAVVNQLLVLT